MEQIDNENEYMKVSRIRRELAKRGYKLMHRRNGQYWLMHDKPVSLDTLEMLVQRTSPKLIGAE